MVTVAEINKKIEKDRADIKRLQEMKRKLLGKKPLKKPTQKRDDIPGSTASIIPRRRNGNGRKPKPRPKPKPKGKPVKRSGLQVAPGQNIPKTKPQTKAQKKADRPPTSRGTQPTESGRGRGGAS